MTDTTSFYINQKADAGSLMLLTRRAGARFWPGQRVLYRAPGQDKTTHATVRAVLAHISVRVALPDTARGTSSRDLSTSADADVSYRLWLENGEHVCASAAEVQSAKDEERS